MSLVSVPSDDLVVQKQMIRSLRYTFENTKVGDKLLMLREGFNGGIGVIRMIYAKKSNEFGNYFEVVNSDFIVNKLYEFDPVTLSHFSKFCYKFKIMEYYQYVKITDERIRVKWYIDNLGYDISRKTS